MPIATYDPAQILCSVKGVPLSGFSKGTKLKVSRSEESFRGYVGTDGDVSRAKSNNRSGMIECTLASTSPSNDFLSAIAAADETAGTGVVTIMVKDLNGTTLAFCDAAFIQKPADSEFSDEVTERTWSFWCGQLSYTVGGNATNIVTG